MLKYLLSINYSLHRTHGYQILLTTWRNGIISQLCIGKLFSSLGASGRPPPAPSRRSLCRCRAWGTGAESAPVWISAHSFLWSVRGCIATIVALATCEIHKLELMYYFVDNSRLSNYQYLYERPLDIINMNIYILIYRPNAVSIITSLTAIFPSLGSWCPGSLWRASVSGHEWLSKPHRKICCLWRFDNNPWLRSAPRLQ